MQPIEWIRSKLSEGATPKTVRSQYQIFKKETGSTMTHESYRRKVNDVAKKIQKTITEEPATSDAPKIKTEVTGPDTTIVSESHEIRTLEQLIAYCKVDLNKYEVTKHVVNSWGSADNPSFQVKAWLSVIGNTEPTQEEILENLKDIVSSYKPERIYIEQQKDSNGSLLIDPVDAHIGAMSYNNDETLAEQCEQYKRSVYDILSQAKKNNGYFDEIVFDIGHDLININADKPETKKGMPQEVNSYSHQICRAVLKMEIDLIYELAHHAKRVKVICTFGNHDSHNMMWLALALKEKFSECKNIEIDAEFEERKFHKYGCTVFMHTHKPMRQQDKMSIIMFHELKEAGFLTDDVRYYEVLCGHLHEKRKTDHESETTNQKITQRVLSSISGDHRYSVAQYGHTVKESQGFFYDKKKGFKQSYCYRE